MQFDIMVDPQYLTVLLVFTNDTYLQLVSFCVMVFHKREAEFSFQDCKLWKQSC